MNEAASIPLRVLLIEDSEDDTQLVLRWLRKDGFVPAWHRVEEEPGLRRALRDEPWDLVLCDYVMPRFGAPQALAVFQSFHLDIPFIVLSGTIGEDIAVAMMKDGVHDYVMKQNPARLLPAIRRELHEAEERAAGHRAEQELAHLAYYDPLTGLANRSLLIDRLAQAVVYARRDAGRLALVQIDLDRFKGVNDALGQAGGDQLLCGVAQRLREAAGTDATVARLGGDIFAALIPRVFDADTAQQGADRLRGALGEPFLIEGQAVSLTASAGVAVYPGHGDDAITLLRHAESAMVEARGRGGHATALYSPASEGATRHRFALEANLWRALREQEFVLHYQPQVDLHSGAVVGVEALVRWRDPVRGLVLPDGFIGLAEDIRAILPLGAWILEQACRDYARWRQDRCAPPRLSINLSVVQLQDPAIGEVLARARRDYFHAGEGVLEVEVTESVLMRDTGRTAALLGALRAQGMQVALDDFGTGYSSLAYLKHLPIDVLKIDKSFVDDVASNTKDQAIVASIIALAHNLKLQVLAEGVETADQAAFLRASGCDSAQGYFFSRPLSCEAVAAFMGQHGG